MASLLWGKVYYKDQFAGLLKQEPGSGSSFSYDDSYLKGKNPQIAYSLPLHLEPQVFQTELPPFFDNLVAEGWLEEAQTKLLGKRYVSRFELLLAFGQDCAGAVSIIDPSPEKISKTLINVEDPKELALLNSRASLSGVQPKLAIIERHGIYYPIKFGELSTHIAKFSSRSHYDLVANEYLTTIAYKCLLPEDTCVEMHLGNIHGFDEEALIIKRFDRLQGKRIHFEEFNQLLNQPSNNKYDGSYQSIADFISNTPGCLSAEIYRFYLRVLAGILLGNTNMHLKNFAMFHTPDGLRLTPTYDQVAAYLYGYKQLALSFCSLNNLAINKITPLNIIELGTNFGLNQQTIIMAAETLRKNLPNAIQAVATSSLGSEQLKQKILELIDQIWKETFALIGAKLLQKQ